MSMRTQTWVLVTLAAAALCGCFKIRLFVVTEEEALANQITGLLADLDQDLAEYESVRGVDEEGAVRTPPEQTEGVQRIIAAQQRRQFNSDDIRVFLENGSAGENNRGMLEYRPTQRPREDPAYAAFVQATLAQENEDRLTLMNRVIEVNEDYSQRDLHKIQKVFAQQNRDAAEPGVWIQAPDTQDDNGDRVSGKWVQKKAFRGRRVAAPR